MKKALSLLMAGVMCVGLLAGCGGQSGESQSSTSSTSSTDSSASTTATSETSNKKIDTLRIAFVPSREPEEIITATEPLKQMLWSGSAVETAGTTQNGAVIAWNILAGIFHPDTNLLFNFTTQGVPYLLLETICIAFLGTIVGAIISVPLAFLSASNLTPKPVAFVGRIIWNSTTLECDRKFRNFWGSTRAVHRLSDTICIENGYSIVEAPKRRGQSYNKWLGDAAKPSHKEQLRQAIDRALAKKPASLEELLRLLEQDGFTVHRRGKTISISAEGWGNNVRFDRLGDGYTLDDLLAVLSGQKEHTPRKKTAAQAAPPKVNLLVDIQDKLKAGKGAGYARWAKVFNLKQMAQTLNYLSEHGLLDYTDLETKTAEATARYNALSGKIKAAEKRMAEIAVLRTHIINYAKTRETYVAYRKAGYSRKFYAEHEDEIRLHQAAKEAFNELNMKKLPTIKELQTEYAQLLADKKTTYAEYRQARAAMRELLTVKNNVDRVLAMEPTEPQQKEKDHGQR